MDYKELIDELEYEADYQREVSEDFDLADSLQLAATAIETLLVEREAARWISVEEKVPETSHEVLVYSPADGVSIGAYMGDKLWLVKVSYPEPPTHWMPLPTPPDRQQMEKVRN